MEKSRSGRGWIIMAVLLLLPALLTALAFLVSGMFGLGRLPAIPDFGAGGWQIVFSVGIVLLQTMNVALYVVVVMVTLALSANSISREKAGKTWDNLLLTNIDSRRVVLGKWWASVLATWGDHFMIALLRIGLVAWLIMAMDMLGALPAPAWGLPIGVGYILPLVIVVAAYTFIDATFTAAIGVTIPLLSLHGSIIGTLVLALRLTTSAAAIAWFVTLVRQIHENGGFNFLPLAAAGLVVCVLLTVGMLRLAMWFAVQALVSPPQR